MLLIHRLIEPSREVMINNMWKRIVERDGSEAEIFICQACQDDKQVDPCGDLQPLRDKDKTKILFCFFCNLRKLKDNGFRNR